MKYAFARRPKLYPSNYGKRIGTFPEKPFLFAALNGRRALQTHKYPPHNLFMLYSGGGFGSPTRLHGFRVHAVLPTNPPFFLLKPAPVCFDRQQLRRDDRVEKGFVGVDDRTLDQEDRAQADRCIRRQDEREEHDLRPRRVPGGKARRDRRGGRRADDEQDHEQFPLAVEVGGHLLAVRWEGLALGSVGFCHARTPVVT